MVCILYKQPTTNFMSEVEITKHNIVSQLRKLCAHCFSGRGGHSCPMQEIVARVEAIRGVPLIVNNEFRGALWIRV